MKSHTALTAVRNVRDLPYRVLRAGLQMILGLGLLGTASPLAAQEPEEPAAGSTLQFTGSGGGGPTFLSEAQTVTVQDAMGAVLVTAEEYRLRTKGMEAWLATCQSMRPDLPDARVLPSEIADRVGKLSFAVFNREQVNFSFRSVESTDPGGAEYVLTVDGSQADSVSVTEGSPGTLTAAVIGAPMIVVRNKEESFHCANAADFTVKIEP